MSGKSSSPVPLSVALIGNPNTGKSTLFNALSGQNVRTGNFPGVTVEARYGTVECADGFHFQLIDLPGTYSLAPRSPDEMVAVDVLLGEQPGTPVPQVVICVVDAANLERNLYLFTQLLELQRPVVLVLNMWDNAGQRGLEIDVRLLEQRWGVPIIPAVASQRIGIEEVKAAVRRAAEQPAPAPLPQPAPLTAALQEFRSVLRETPYAGKPDFLLARVLLDRDGEAERTFLKQVNQPNAAELLANCRARLEAAGFRIPLSESRWRYDVIRERLANAVRDEQRHRQTISDRIDRVLTHPVWGVLVFAATMLLVFQSIYSWAGPIMEGIESLIEYPAAAVTAAVPPGMLRSLLLDGALAGVGGVIVFLPQIVLLFLFIGILEDCGYMARAAFLADRLMAPLGLNGRSFVPLMSSFACAVPGIMATRTIESWRDRMVTILIAPLMSCSARLPVYILLITAFVPDSYLGGWLSLRALVLFGMHLVGLLVAIPVALLLRRIYFQGEPSLFVMEMPPYKWPTWWVISSRVAEQGKEFLVRAGTLIFATSVLIWAAGYFPSDRSALHQLESRYELLNAIPEPTVEELAEMEQIAEQQAELNGELIRTSFLGRAGALIAPAIHPLGWDWRIGVAVIASFPAREVVIAALGTIYSLGSEVDAEDSGLQAALQNATWEDGSPVFTLPVALSVMVFFALCSQCAATLMVIRRETKSWRWPVFTFVYMTTLAYLGAWLTTSLGNLCGLG